MRAPDAPGMTRRQSAAVPDAEVTASKAANFNSMQNATRMPARRKRTAAAGCEASARRLRNRHGSGVVTASAGGDLDQKDAHGAGDGTAEAPAERDSGRRSGGGRRRKDSGIGGVTGSDSKDLRAVMAGTGEVLAADMAESTALHAAQDWEGLRDRLQREGYLLLRGVLPTVAVLQVRVLRNGGGLRYYACFRRCLVGFRQLKTSASDQCAMALKAPKQMQLVLAACDVELNVPNHPCRRAPSCWRSCTPPSRIALCRAPSAAR